jgi:hypothetical protein
MYCKMNENKILRSLSIIKNFLIILKKIFYPNLIRKENFLKKKIKNNKKQN